MDNPAHLSTVPCKSCLTLAICLATYCKMYLTENPPPVPLLMQKCTLIRYYMYRVDRESDRRELVPRNCCLNISNVHRFFRNEIQTQKSV